MNVDYYALLVKAVAGKDVAARGRVYKEAYQLVRRSNLSPADMSSHMAALEDTVRRIENDIAAQERDEPTSAASIGKVLATGAGWKTWAVGGLAVIAVVAVAALSYGYLAPRDPRGVASAPSRQRPALADNVVPDLAAGIDGGSSAADLPFALQRQVVFYRTTIVPGSIVVDRENRFLYLIDYNNSARRYGIGIAQECQKGGSLFRITSKLEWPGWGPSADPAKGPPAVLATAARPGNQLGSRALVLDRPGLLIHGTNSPKTIGHLVASGCIRLVNDDVEDLYRRVPLETRVIFVS